MAITIIGYRGTGKTTIGAELARRLDWQYVDTDPEVERIAGKSIAAIFAEHGEPHFRALESDALRKHLCCNRTVISAGGGAILDLNNRRSMQQAGPVVWLQADIGTIADRLQSDPTTHDRRPSLTNTDVVTEIETVLTRRYPLYQETASIVVNTTNRTPAAIVDDIVSRLPSMSSL